MCVSVCVHVSVCDFFSTINCFLDEQWHVGEVGVV